MAVVGKWTSLQSARVLPKRKNTEPKQIGNCLISVTLLFQIAAVVSVVVEFVSFVVILPSKFFSPCALDNS